MGNRGPVFAFLLCIGLVITIWLWISLTAKESAESFLRRMPIGSKISDLQAAIPKNWDDIGVIVWLPLKEPAEREFSSPFREVLGKVAFGSTWYSLKDTDWRFIGEIPDQPRFTGEIFLSRDLLPSGQVAMLVYIDGVLKWKDWGYHPG